MARRKQKKYPPWAVAVVFIFCLIVGAVSALHNPAQPQPQKQAAAQSVQSGSTETLVYYLDVGQGDCELIHLKTGEYILIDSGTTETAEKLVRYLKNLGVQKIDYLIATHPHTDHIGGMEQVVSNLEIGKIYMPKISDNQIPTTSTYEKLLEAIDRKGLKITAAKGGMTIVDSGGEKLEVFAPNSPKYSGLNSYSVVTKLTSGEKSFLFTGDAETDSEKEMTAKSYGLKCDVLKCGHHGSSTSTSAAFLKKVSPSTVIISCGVNNDYGHPNKQVVSRLQKAGVAIYRTDEQDTIVAACDGKNIRFTTNQESIIR